MVWGVQVDFVGGGYFTFNLRAFMQESSALTYIQRNIEVCTVCLWVINVQIDGQSEERQDSW
jgi:hypothetical protein